jgi:hypothetical protein
MKSTVEERTQTERERNSNLNYNLCLNWENLSTIYLGLGFDHARARSSILTLDARVNIFSGVTPITVVTSITKTMIYFF